MTKLDEFKLLIYESVDMDLADCLIGLLESATDLESYQEAENYIMETITPDWVRDRKSLEEQKLDVEKMKRRMANPPYSHRSERRRFSEEYDKMTSKQKNRYWAFSNKQDKKLEDYRKKMDDRIERFDYVKGSTPKERKKSLKELKQQGKIICKDENDAFQKEMEAYDKMHHAHIKANNNDTKALIKASYARRINDKVDHGKPLTRQEEKFKMRYGRHNVYKDFV